MTQDLTKQQVEEYDYLKPYVYGYLDALKPEYREEAIDKVLSHFPMDIGKICTYVTNTTNEYTFTDTLEKVCIAGLPLPKILDWSVFSKTRLEEYAYEVYGFSKNIFFQKPIFVKHSSDEECKGHLVSEIAFIWDTTAEWLGLQSATDILYTIVSEYVHDKQEE